MMKTYPASFIYLFIISSAILIMMSSSNWYMMWMALELSMFGFIPLFSSTAKTMEGMMKYFLFQATGSGMFMMAMLSKMELLLFLSIFMKLGMFPFFLWLPMVMDSISWPGCLILSTIQKMPSIMLMMSLQMNKNLLILSILTMMMASILGFNQTILKKLMAYSSMSHTSWITIILFFSKKMTMMYILIYFINITLLFMSFQKTNTQEIQPSSTPQSEALNQMLIMLILAGIPPFSIFMFKIMVFYTFQLSTLFIIIILISTYITTFYYLTFIIPKVSTMWTKITTKMSIIIMMNLIYSFVIM